jgi:GMP synthase PP-ATPase subunit
MIELANLSPKELLALHASILRAATRIINAVKGVNRVLYDVTPGTIEGRRAE